MTTFYSRTLLSFVLIVTAINVSLSQNNKRRLATISYKDSVVKAELFRKESSQKANDDIIYYWFSQNSIHSTQGGYSGILLHGRYSSFFTNNNLCQLGTFCHGIKSGKWQSWYPDGKLKEVSWWMNGMREGKTVTYNENGSVKEVREYKRNVEQIKKERKKGDRKIKENSEKKKDVKVQDEKKKRWKFKWPSLTARKKMEKKKSEDIRPQVKTDKEESKSKINK
jgi:antitoxin component YwqK of YwqJK toxin-antitoxin module